MKASSLAICSALVAAAAPAVALNGILNHQLTAGVVAGVVMLGGSWCLACAAEHVALKEIARGNMCKIPLVS